MSELIGHGQLSRTDDDVTFHLFPVTVYWEDTDAGGIVYHANYLKFTERARSDLLKILQINQQQLMAEEGHTFVVRDCHLEFLKPAVLEDQLVVKTMLSEMKGASLTMTQDVLREGETLIKSKVRIAFLQKSGRPARFSPQIKDKFASVM
ncbi:tol-pal system-associated acyl-CoA thioesterase [Sneathiella limimaris]|uniref:tol-pal system-associated acyl-CoA thioesterase n=1 Tax=Sneathiella limimaris TaxID=1964213 RepID=UPI00146B583B|nr:tol-pal system-associated acyl-CoA thioesterase [Sneathiella limimaris]